jgi:hypothetical protein
MVNIQLLAVAASLSLLAVILQLVRQRKLREQYSLLWLACGGILLTCSLFDQLLLWIARLVGIYYPPAVLLPITIFLGVILGIHFSLMISKLSEQNKNLAQEIALLKNLLEALRQKSEKE